MSYKTIDKFNLDEVLTNIDVIEEVDRFGDTWRHKQRKLSEGVTLFVYESGQAALEIDDNTAIEFVYSEEVADLFARFDEISAIKLFDTLNRNNIKLSSNRLNKGSVQ